MSENEAKGNGYLQPPILRCCYLPDAACDMILPHRCEGMQRTGRGPWEERGERGGVVSWGGEMGGDGIQLIRCVIAPKVRSRAGKGGSIRLRGMGFGRVSWRMPNFFAKDGWCG